MSMNNLDEARVVLPDSDTVYGVKSIEVLMAKDSEEQTNPLNSLNKIRIEIYEVGDDPANSRVEWITMGDRIRVTNLFGEVSEISPREAGEVESIFVDPNGDVGFKLHNFSLTVYLSAGDSICFEKFSEAHPKVKEIGGFKFKQLF